MQTSVIKNWMPGLATLLSYNKSWLSADLRAGLSVAAVALPVAIAYAELAGVSAVVGLYSCILPMIAYALFGSSRQLIVGPDAATCAVIAAVVAPLAMGDANIHWQLAIMMTLMTGTWCLLASYFRLGAIADLLSRPILNGLLNGVAITIIVDQIAKVCGFTTTATQLIERIINLPVNLANIQLNTLLVSFFTLALMWVCKRFRPGWPAPLIAIVLMAIMSWQMDLAGKGITIVGGFNSGLVIIHWGYFQPGLLREVLIPALNLALVSFVSMMLTARSFAAKNGYEINSDTELRALGIANIVSALSQGFAISGADSRTAVNDANGGKSQMVSIIAALVILLVLLFLIRPMRYIPLASLGVILIYSAWSLLDFKSLWQLRKRHPEAALLGLITLLAVLLVGVLPGIGLAVLVGLLQFLRTVFRPTEQLLGINEEGLIHSLGNSDTVKPVEGVMMYRFNSPLTYFNVAYFKRRILHLIDSMPVEPGWVVIDAVASFTHADISVLVAIDELRRDLRTHKIRLVLAGRRTELSRWFKESYSMEPEEKLLIVSDLYLALRLIQSMQSMQEQPQEEIRQEEEQNINLDDLLAAD